jgi:nucleoside-diphosphate-sugar epimerase
VKATVLVTGAGGFIGSHLCKALVSRGCRVVGVDLKYPQAGDGGLPKGLQAVSGDFRKRELMRELLDGVEIIFHLASAHLQVNLPDTEYWDVNVRSLRPLIKMAHQNGVKRFVHVSTVGVYGNLENWPANEKTPCKPQNIYSETKLAGEAEVRNFCRKKDFPFVILRPTWVYGPGCMRTLKLYQALRKGHFMMIGKGQNMRHPIYIQDMLCAFALAMKADNAVGETFVIGGSRAFSTAELVASFCKVFHFAAPKIRLPLVLGKIAISAVEVFFNLAGKAPPVSRRSLEFFSTNNAFDISKAKELLGFFPEFTLEQGLERSRSWLESQYSA